MKDIPVKSPGFSGFATVFETSAPATRVWFPFEKPLSFFMAPIHLAHPPALR
jgi:hypothetical protein